MIMISDPESDETDPLNDLCPVKAQSLDGPAGVRIIHAHE